MIKQYFKVVVSVPVKVWEEFSHTKDYELLVMAATNDAIESGTNSYGPEQWATYTTRPEAVNCEKRLMNINYHFSAKLADLNGGK